MKKCIALVVGINDYLNTDVFPKLTNPIRDAEAICRILRDLKFEVELCVDEDDDIVAAYYGDFKEKLEHKKYDVAVFYFAGHGAIVNNYDSIIYKLAPSPLIHSGMITAQHSKKVNDILNDMRGANKQINIVIIDACRKISGMRGETAGGAPTGINIPNQTFVAYSTSPGAGAADSPHDPHSPFAQSLLNHIKELNLPIELLFKRVRAEMNVGALRQLSWDYSCLIDEFSFNYGQLDPYYDKPYSEDAYKYVDFVSPSVFIAQVISVLSSPDNSRDVKDILVANVHNKSLIDMDSLFVVGRLIGVRAAENDVYCRSMLKDRIFIKLYNEENTNHLLRGVYYSLYFDEQDCLREHIIGDRSYWQLLETLFELSSTKDDIRNFISIALLGHDGHFNYVLGQSKQFRFQIDTSSLDCVTEDNKEVVGIKVQDDNRSNILPCLPIDKSFFDTSDLRDAISTYYQVPSQRVSLKGLLNLDTDFVFTKFRVDDLNYRLYEWMNARLVDEVCILSSNSYITEVGDVTLKEVLDDGMQLLVSGSCEISVHMEYDHEESEDEFYPCTFKLYCMLTDEGEYEIDEDNSEYKVDTDSYYS